MSRARACASRRADVAVSVARVFHDFMVRHLPDSGPIRAPVHDAMRTRVYICAPEDTLARAAAVDVGKRSPGCLPVCGPGRQSAWPCSPIATSRWPPSCSGSIWPRPASQSAMSRGLSTCSPDDELGPRRRHHASKPGAVATAGGRRSGRAGRSADAGRRRALRAPTLAARKARPARLSTPLGRNASRHLRAALPLDSAATPPAP